MKAVVACSALTLALISGLSAFAADPANSMMLRLAVGQRIQMKPSPISSGIEIVIYPEKQWKAFPPGYNIPQILEIYPDYIVVQLEPNLEQTISAHSIHLITKWVTPKVVAPAAVVPGGPAVAPGAPAVAPGAPVAPVAPAAPAAPTPPPAPAAPVPAAP